MLIDHFSSLRDNLATLSRSLSKSKEKSIRLHSYKIHRIAENLRLDLPGQRVAGFARFVDKKGYPKDYPPHRGPNVSIERENAFCGRLATHLPNLGKAAKSLSSSNAVTVKASHDEMVRLLESLEQAWSIQQRQGIEDSYNEINRCPQSALPEQFCRYVGLSDFLLYTLFDRIKAPEVATPVGRKSFLRQLEAEHAKPGSAWKQLAEWWHGVRMDIRKGRRAFHVRRKKGERDVTFFGQTALEVEKSAVFAPRSKSMLHHVVRQLGLPDWETEKRRIEKLGCVKLQMPSSGSCAWRPTALDVALGWSYFFLPAERAKTHGQTWCLTEQLDRNDKKNHTGHPEWIMLFPPNGIPCQRLGIDGRPEPAFELVGLSFSPKHAELFTE